jgi:hypothetical protein
MTKHLRLGIWTLSIIVLLCLETIRNGHCVCLEVVHCEEIPFLLGPMTEGMRVALPTGLTVYELHIY